MVTCAASGTKYSKTWGYLAKAVGDSAHAVSIDEGARDGIDAAVDNPCSTNARMFLREGEEKTFATRDIIDIVASSLLALSYVGIVFVLPAALFYMEHFK